MRRLLRVLIVTGFVLAALLLTLTGTVVYVVRDSFPSYDGEADLPGLSAEVEVIRDEAGAGSRRRSWRCSRRRPAATWTTTRRA